MTECGRHGGAVAPRVPCALSCMQVWDIRTRRPGLTIPGPLLCGGTGAAVCPGTHVLATASWRPQHPLQAWDLRTGGLLTNLPVAPESSPQEPPAVDLNEMPPARGGTAAVGHGRLHSFRAYGVVWLSRGVVACGGSGVRHGLRVRLLPPLLLAGRVTTSIRGRLMARPRQIEHHTGACCNCGPLCVRAMCACHASNPCGKVFIVAFLSNG